MAKFYIQFTREEIMNELPYQLIAETYCRSVWGTGKRKRLMHELFTDSEWDTVIRICKQSRQWALVTGVPNEGVMMSIKTRLLWDRIAEFCLAL